MVDERVVAEKRAESNSSRQAAANATDDGMRIAQDDDEDLAEESTECGPEIGVVQKAQTDGDS
jgi:hypothetical protein